jgi:hypothetical protein
MDKKYLTLIAGIAAVSALSVSSVSAASYEVSSSLDISYLDNSSPDRVLSDT